MSALMYAGAGLLLLWLLEILAFFYSYLTTPKQGVTANPGGAENPPANTNPEDPTR